MLQSQGQIDGLVRSCARFAEKVSVLDAYQRQGLPAAETVRIGPPRVFERLWREVGLPAILEEVPADRRYEFAVERAVFVTVLHRLMASGSDRAAEHWCRDYAIDGVQDLQLHHLYRAMAWLGEELGTDQQAGATASISRPPAPTREDFDSPQLPIDFQWLRTPWPEEIFSLTARPGYL